VLHPRRRVGTAGQRDVIDLTASQGSSVPQTHQAGGRPPEGSSTNEPIGIGHATSDDGRYWTVDPDPLIRHHVDEAGTVSSVGSPSAVAVDGEIALS
jgi:hypothetical protein